MWVFGERFQRFSPDLLLAAQVLLPEEQETRGEERVIPQQSPIMAAIQGNETRICDCSMSRSGRTPGNRNVEHGLGG